jgi:hypothetical protein
MERLGGCRPRTACQQHPTLPVVLLEHVAVRHDPVGSGAVAVFVELDQALARATVVQNLPQIADRNVEAVESPVPIHLRPQQFHELVAGHWLPASG